MTTATPETMVNEERLNAIIGQAVGDFGGVLSAALVVIGDKLGLYRTLAERGPSTPAELAMHTGASDRYLRPWLVNQAAAGYVEYDPATGRYHLTPEQEMVFARDDTPASLAGGFVLVTSIIRDEPLIAEAVRTGGGLNWADHSEGLFEGTARFFKAGYLGNIVSNWIPALDGVEAKLQRGALVADLGCGYGTSTVIMAQAYPNSRFIGFDNHEPSIIAAREEAERAGVSDRVTFEVASAQDFPGSGYDLVTFFDALHDMGHPLQAVQHVKEVLDPHGTVMLVEPMAGNTVEENFNPVGRIYSAASVLVCSAHAIAEGGDPLGTIATDADLRRVFETAGYRRFRRAAETPTNRVFEATL